MDQLPMTAHWWNNVQRAELLGIKACIRQHHPSTLFAFAMSTKAGTTSFQGIQMRYIVTGSVARLPREDVLTGCAHRISAFDPLLVGSSTASLVIQTGLSR